MGRLRESTRVERRFEGVWLYALYQVPGMVLAGLVLWLLLQWGWLSAGWALGLFFGWVAKDCALYWALRDVFRPPHAGGPLVGARGVVETALDPRGLVRLSGELWQAEPLSSGRAIVAGVPVVVRATRGLTLLVAPLDPPSEPDRRVMDGT